MHSQSIAALILRIGMGGMMLTHGWKKFMKVIEGSWGFADPIGVGEVPTLILAVLAEFICPILIIIGWRTKLACILPAMTMFVAAFVIHIDDPWKKMEFPLLYLVGFAALFFMGSGKYSLDRK